VGKGYLAGGSISTMPPTLNSIALAKSPGIVIARIHQPCEVCACAAYASTRYHAENPRGDNTLWVKCSRWRLNQVEPLEKRIP
jgi:hypothetical protein